MEISKKIQNGWNLRGKVWAKQGSILRKNQQKELIFITPYILHEKCSGNGEKIEIPEFKFQDNRLGASFGPDFLVHQVLVHF